MKYVLLVTYVVMIWLFCRSRRIVCGGSRQEGIFKISYRMSLYLLTTPLFRSLMQEKLAARLAVLYPVYERKSLIRHYYAQKLGTVLLLLFAGVHLLFFMELSEQRNSPLKDGYLLTRGTYGQDDEALRLIVEDAEKRTPVDYELAARKYSGEEIGRQMDAFENRLPGLILGENESLDCVRGPLRLTASYEDYGFSVGWESSDYSLLDDDGSVYNETLTEPALVTLTAVLAYEEIERETALFVRICPRERTAEEAWHDAIRQAIRQADDAGREQEALALPERIAKVPVTYRLSEGNSYPLYLAGLAGIAVLLFFAKDRDLEKKLKEREKDLLLRYPEFVSQLVLLLGAGMSVRSVLRRLSEEPSMGIYLGQELKLLARDLGNGVLEAQALDTFGKRCGAGPYIKLSGLLIQNMKKGNRELFDRLREESADAFARRKNDARRLGEEAGTKLLLPMMGMLLVVMIVIILPAFLSFGL